MESRMKLPPANLHPVPGESLAPAAERGAELPFDAVLTFDASGTIREFTPGAQQLFGWLREDAAGGGLAERLFPGELQRRFLEDLVHQFDCTDPAPDGRRVELVASRPDGRRVPVELAVACLGDGGARTFVAFVRDMAGRKRLVEELRGQADRLGAIAKVQQELAASEAAVATLGARIPAMAQRALDADGAALELIEDDELVYQAVSGILEGHAGTRLAHGGSLSGLALRENRALLSEDCATDPRTDHAACHAVGA